MPTVVTLDALEPDAPVTGMLLDRTRAHLLWGAPLELRGGRCEITFVGYDGATDEPRRWVEGALDAAAGEVGVEWAAYFDLAAASPRLQGGLDAPASVANPATPEELPVVAEDEAGEAAHQCTAPNTPRDG